VGVVVIRDTYQSGTDQFAHFRSTPSYSLNEMNIMNIIYLLTDIRKPPP
jgi:hypothetical protein